MLSYAGQLLVATPRLLDPNFVRCVILMLDHDEDGALGVVINRPTELPLSTVLPGWGDAVVSPPLLFTGGPVAVESALGIGLAAGRGPEQSFKRLTGDFILQTRVELIGKGVEAHRKAGLMIRAGQDPAHRHRGQELRFAHPLLLDHQHFV